ncbi:MAG TPA: DUF3563 family protein [Casimicrobiaceae bacterium]
MKATNFLLDSPRLTGLVGGLAPRNPAPRDSAQRDEGSRCKAPTRSPSLLERLDRWFWRQQVRDREAYLAGAQDIFELEERMRRLERGLGSRYY